MKVKKQSWKKQLESLDVKVTSIMSEFGFVEPTLTEIQEKELDNRLAPLDDQYYEIYGEEECDEHESDDESDEFHNEE